MIEVYRLSDANMYIHGLVVLVVRQTRILKMKVYSFIHSDYNCGL